MNTTGIAPAPTVTGLDGVTRPQGWHVWQSDTGAVYAVRAYPDGGATTLGADTLDDLRAELARRGVQL